ncbi:MAG TPA: glycosyltransferase family 39 protein, partial [Candidatus Obscuribacterales bacterium]
MVNGTEIKPTQNELSPSDFVRGRGERGLSALSLFRILTAIYFALRLPWLLTLPVSEAPDEPNHFWVCHFLSTHFTLPTAQQVFAGGTPAEYGSLPPFGYLPHALISACFPEQMMPFVSRFGSLLAGLPAVWAAFAIGREIFPRTSLAALALPLLIVVQPQLVFVNSYTNTDSTTTSLTSIAILLVVLAIKRGLSMWQAVVAGFLLGWTALSKHTGLCIVPALGVGLLAAAFVHRDSVKSAAKKLGALAVVFLLTSAWWFVRNYHEFSGDWLGSKTMYETWAKILPRHNGQIVHPWPPVSQIGWWRYVFFDYWGLFGYMDRYLWRPIYIAYLGFVIASVIGWFKHSSWKRAHFRAGAAQTSVPAEGSGE